MPPVVEPDSPRNASLERAMHIDPTTPDLEASATASTFVPATDRPAGARLPVALELFVSWVVRDGKGWVRRL